MTTTHQPLTMGQLCLVLEVIAGRMGTLNQMLMEMQGACPADWEQSTRLDAAQCHAQSVGAMADGAIGGAVYGDMNRWFYGPLFADGAGKGGAI